MLFRSPRDREIVRELSFDEALDYIVKNDYCNPHQLIRDDWKMKIRKQFYSEYLSKCEVYLVNTIKKAESTQDCIREILF